MSSGIPLLAHKHTRGSHGINCIQIRVADGVQTAWVNGEVLHELEVAHAPTAMRFCQKTMNDGYPGGHWLSGWCPEHFPSEDRT